jgi:NTP pyrophosphatase (non-canonical NTP hydrolase)
MNTREALNELADAAYKNASDKGFHDADYEYSSVELYSKWTANLHGEISELWEAARRGHLEHPCDKCCPLTCEEEEFADIIIRVLDSSKARGIDIGKAVELKMAYNASREYMHGKLA